MLIDQLPSANPNLTDETVTEQGTNLFKTTWQKIRDLFFGSSASFASDLTVGGVFDVTKRRCSANLSSAGWYRAVKVPAGYGSIRLYIERVYDTNPPEVHNIELLLTYASVDYVCTFVNERSKSSAQLISKVRCTHATGYYYIDIYYTSTSANNVTISFDASTTTYYGNTVEQMGLSGVAASPSGETVLEEYTFAGNTEQYADATENGVRHLVKRTGKTVTLTIESAGGTSCPSGQYTTVYTVPSWAAPWSTVYAAVDTYGGNNVIGAMIGTDGTVKIYPVLSDTTYYRFTITYQMA